MEETPWKDKLQAIKLAVKWTYQSSKPLTLAVLATAIFGGLISIIEPYLFKLVLDRLVGEVPSATAIAIGIIGILAIYAVTKITQNIFWDLHNLIKRVHAVRIERQIMLEMMSHVSNLDAIYFEDPHYYNTLTRATHGTWRVLEIFWQFTFLISQIVSVIVILTALLAFDWRIVILILGGIIPSILLVFRTADVEWSAFSETSSIFRHAAYYRSLLTERPEAIKEIRLFGLRDYFLKRFRNLFSDFIKKHQKAAQQQFKWYAIVGIVEGSLSALAAWLVIVAFQQGRISIGDLTFYWALLFQFSGHVRWVVRMLGDMNTHATFVTPIIQLFRFVPQIVSPKEGKPFPAKIRKGIEFRNVSFSYPGSDRPILKNVSFTIKPGESIAIVGENGSGKTTLIKLLVRLYDPTEGMILIDGINIKDFSLEDLNNNIGVIFQDFMRYEAIVEDNIRYGKITADAYNQKVHKAALDAGAWDFIKDLEKTYRTHIGKTLQEEGIELSGGQWQKIALARAFFKDSPLLILDEPTAAVDPKAEFNLFQKFEELTKDKTTILISHRFSTVRMADRIIVLEGGKIVEEGSHQELMQKDGLYKMLFNLQARGYVM